MAGAGYKLFSTGEVLTATNVNTYLMQQSVMVFASAAARTTALSGVLAEGMISYRTDSHVLEYYNGSAWTTLSVSIPLTTKGDLFTYSTANARLAVGSDGYTLVADSTQSTGLAWALGNPLALNAQTGTTYTFVLTDNYKLVTASNAAAQTYTIPPNSSVAYPTGSVINVIQIGAGQVSFAQGAGVTIASTGATATAPKLRVQYSAASAIKVATDTWYVVGDIA